MRPGAHYRHIADYHIKKLGEFIYTRAPYKSTNSCYPFIVARSLSGLRIIIYPHTPKLITHKGLVVSS